MEEKVLKVYELNKMVKTYIEGNEIFKNIFVRGEISNITYYKSGHLYFTLKDEKASVKCAAFSYKLKRIASDLKAGEAVKIFGHVTLYDVNGQYQILVDHVEKENKLGLLYEKMEKLKKDLQEKGYFDEELKKRVPFLPKNIGIITSGTGAAVRDVIKTAKNRYENINIYVFPTKVQGQGSEKEIANAIKKMDKLSFLDLIIFGRGGGSIEDLWSFNTKEVAEAVYKAKTPMVSAVGHEIDFVISDFVADLRAATPTQAAELSVPVKKELYEKLKMKDLKLKAALKKVYTVYKLKLDQKKESYFIKNFSKIIDEKNIEIIDMEEDLKKVFLNLLAEKRNVINEKKTKIESLNPKSVLKRGYTITESNDKILKDSDEIKVGDKLKTTFYNGKVESTVL